ncbi:MAG: CsfB protein [Clostridium butyricum]|nr:CsfB protein [Clostridium butyricum]
MKKLNKKCFMCGTSRCDGIILNERHICKECEQEIINIDVMKPSYTNYIKLIKRILFNSK